MSILLLNSIGLRLWDKPFSTFIKGYDITESKMLDLYVNVICSFVKCSRMDNNLIDIPIFLYEDFGCVVLN
jgi:hypothetical protein